VVSVWKRFTLRAREWAMVAGALVSTDHPVLAHLIVTRRCNLACSYCNEYDHRSAPVPTEKLARRVDLLAELGTSVVTLTGGEPLLHPDLEEIIARVRRHRMIAGMITNGYLLSKTRIRRLNEAGLDHLQISIDNLQPDRISKKSLKVLDKKLVYLAEEADFPVNINTVLGSGIPRPEEALLIARRAVELGFTCTVGIIHDGEGVLKPLRETERRVYDQVRRLGKRGYTRLTRYYQENLASGKPNGWSCRAGARYLYVCEDGLVHYCSQQRGRPGVPLERYRKEDIRREHRTAKGCAPYCTISCVHQASLVDFWRAPQSRPELVERPEVLSTTPASSSLSVDLVELRR